MPTTKVAETLHGLRGVCLNLDARRASALLERMELVVDSSRFDEARELGRRLPVELEGIEREFAAGIPWLRS